MSRLIRLAHHAFFLTILALPAPAFAWPPKYGPEFTFTNEALHLAQPTPNTPETPESLKAKNDILAQLEKICRARGNCYRSGDSIVYRDGWWFEVTTDPGVIEIKSKPLTLEQARRFKDRIQTDIFDTCAEFGLKPDPTRGGGHIHTDAQSVLENDVKILRNVVVDFANHPELATGVLYNSRTNSPAFALLPRKNRKAFQRLIADVDSGRVTTIEEFVRRMHTEVYNIPGKNGRKMQALALDRMVPEVDVADQTMQLRCVRAQASAEEFVMELELLEARYDYIRSLKAPQKYLSPALHDTPTKMIVAFHRYVTEAGLDWNRYKALVPKKWHIPNDLEAILSPDCQPDGLLRYLRAMVMGTAKNK